MTDEEVDRALARLERRLDALQDELEAAAPAASAARASGPPPDATPPPSDPAGPWTGAGPLPGAELPPAGPWPGAGPLPGAGQPPDAGDAASGEAADPLEQFGVELRRLAHELVAAYDRVLAYERRARPAGRTLVLEAQADLHDLADLERALAESPSIAEVRLRAYEAGRASLAVELAPRRAHPGRAS